MYTARQKICRAVAHAAKRQTEEAKKDAVNTMITLTETAQKESDAQMLLEAKGFAQTIIYCGKRHLKFPIIVQKL